MSSSSVIQAFGNDFLSAFGIQLGRIVEHVPTEIVNLRKERVMIEELFRLEDDSLLYFVLHASPNPKDLDELMVQLMEHNLKIYEKYEKLINTVVVFGPAISNAKTSIDLGAIKYRISDAIWMSRIDGDEISEDLARKVRHTGELTDEELSRFVLLPFLQTNLSRYERVVEAIEIANQLVDHGKRDLVLKLMKAMTGKLLIGDDFEQIVQSFEKI
ncbi:hypothetical protein BAG01nite_47520 [Brevibacillus agri]|uniref:Uncharacterized protein n=1 Tax=Brevibacillus agri TaxID=51101 RepID=A0A3M8ANA3_9BACL|nr:MULTISPECIES: hypothetical protein [Brevibacillus]ELK41162.1 hypothetical protein D478_15265 [Brevibacillus agri BAB-2500]MBE5394927.1 hypothetical protein [Brevibacillus borstelensis]MCG5252939.1 hypothetical protein [Brevibacillus agri]MED1851665.1 hypothetical protein [Brevibacillus borstelensis]MED3501188.1 hypothetical protein [Brevibacillus agri]